MFHYGKNMQCGSGHDAQITEGCIADLYIRGTGYDLSRYHSHIHYVPYQNIETKKMFCKVSGLTYSIHDTQKNMLEPHYGVMKYQILYEQLFKQLAKN